MSGPNQNFCVALLRLVVLIAMLSAFSPGVTAQDEESKNVAPRTGAINGRVVNENGQPIPHAIIYLGSPMDFMQSRTSATDDDGNFQISGLDALIYTLSASAPGYFLVPRDPEGFPTPYRIGDSVTIPLIKGGVITGTVTSPSGEPMVQTGVRATLIRDANGKAPSPGRSGSERLADDRGIYRIYGLPPGTYIVSANGRGSYGFSNNAYAGEAPTYAPSSTRDAAAEIVVRAGEETTVDIRYRGEPGHAVTGVVTGPMAPSSGATITLAQVVNGVPQAIAFSFQGPNSKGFAFYGVADGDYDVIAQSNLGPREAIASEPRRLTVKGADITGLEVVVKELASIRGRVVLERSTAADCKNKREPLFSETVVAARRSEKGTPKELSAFPNFFGQASPDKLGDFALRSLAPGQFNLQTRFFAKYWYLRSILRGTTGAQPLRGQTPNRQADAARNGISLKFGERMSGLTVTLALGAASLRGALQPAGGTVSSKFYLQLVPAEKESADDVLRFFITPVNADGTFAVNNLPPGRYWALGRIVADNEPQSEARLRAPEEEDARAQLRRAAEAAKTVIEFKPCQNVTNYQLPFKTQPPRN